MRQLEERVGGSKEKKREIESQKERQKNEQCKESLINVLMQVNHLLFF
jgi:hypothetical protein